MASPIAPHNGSRIRILHVLEATFGGTRKHLRYIMDRLDRGRFDVSLACSTLRNPAFERDIVDLENRGIPVTVIQMKRDINILHDVRAFLQLYALMRRGRYHIVHAHSSKAGFLGRMAARCAGVPCIVYSPHAFYFYRGIKGVHTFFLVVERFAGRVTDALVTVSKGEKSIAERFKVCDAGKVMTIENGVDPAEFDLSVDVNAKKSELGIGADHRVVGMVGRMCAQKGYEYFIRSARDVLSHVPHTVFVLVGHGRELAKARTLVSDLGLAENVILTGLRHDIPDIYAVFDVLVLPSIWEGMPYVLLEAMGMGVPVVASDIPGVAEVVIDHATGLLFPPGDVSALSERVISVLSDRERGREMGEAGRQRVIHHYEVNEKMETLAQLYEALVSKSVS